METIKDKTTMNSQEEKRALLAQLLREKARGPKSFPLSFAQQRMWFLDQLEPGGAKNIVGTAVRLSGQLNLGALEHSLNEIIRRHETLRTTFAVTEGEPVQVIAPAANLALTLVNLSALTREEQEAEALRLSLEDAQCHFDLSAGPLLRASLLELNEQEHVLLLSMHHIVADGWSMNIFVRELSVLYRAYSSGEESPLPELPIQYADYAQWQRSWLQGEVLDQQLSYWKEQLADVPVLELPTDRPRPAVQSNRGDGQSFNLSPKLTQDLRELSRKEGVTLFMTLLAAFQVLLSR